ncbi:MAG: DUF167 domain-containing protein [Candidatus Magasanikbacteria bacterium]|nr:DUF167 domain-containing protein [Candidatus Magasanikbacteria bacterium]
MKIAVHLVPTSAQNKIEILTDGSLKAWVTAPPINGAANEALIKLLADYYGVAKSRVRVRRGFKSRKKVIEII